MKIAAFFENIAQGAEQTGISLEAALTQLRDLGLEAVYISYDSLCGNREQLLPLFGKLGLSVEGLHAHMDFAEDPQDPRCLHMIDLAREAGAQHVLYVPGMIRPEQESCRRERLSNMVAALSRAVEYGDRFGIAVSVEDFDGPYAPYNCVDGLAWFLEQVPGLKCSFDTGNFVMYSEDEVEAFHRFRHRICTLHIKDRSKTPNHPEDRAKHCVDGAVVYPTPVGSGYIRIGQIIDLLKADGYRGNLIAELYDYYDMLPGLRQSVVWLNQCLQK